MSAPQSASRTDGDLARLAERIEGQPGFAEVLASLGKGDPAALSGVWGSSRALIAAALARHVSGTLLVVCPHQPQIDEVADDLALFCESTPERFPAWESPLGERVLHDEIHGDRLRVLKRLAAEEPPRVAVTSIQALLQPVPAIADLARRTRRLEAGQTLDADELTRWLAEHGFHGTSAVELPGEFSLRGGILDLFAPDWGNPVRIELFGDEIESLRRFDVASQRSLGGLPAIDVTLLSASHVDRGHLAAHLPRGSWVMLVEPDELQDEGRRYLERMEPGESLHSVNAALRATADFATVLAEGLATGGSETTCELQIESIERFSGDIHRVRDELDTIGGNDEVNVVCDTEAEAERLGEVFRETRIAQAGRLHFRIGHLQAGFRLVREGIVLVSGGELFCRADLVRPARRRLGRAIDSFLELRPRDLVVHLAHGVGRYLGLKLIEKQGQQEEHLELEFHGGTRIFVPVSKIELVQKYVGGSKAHPTLARIGGRSWVRQKEAAEAAVTDLAAEMLQLHAIRAARPGIRLPKESEWEREFVASFPYPDTADQITSMAAIRDDMQAPRPMDRLLCGDVGFGKTELAVRAAFKAVDAGYQVAVLVPTTILAAQHTRTFTDRMAEFPFQIATLSRFATRKQQRETLARLAAGEVDIVVGTHRLAQPDVSFQNLGLVIIDEEQRFGVDVKERLKSLRHTVNVLTMTATPIPRTLHMSLLGIRDISNLETPPEDRIAVETRVTRLQPELVRHAILRELNRGGQIFFVHNRVQDIERVADKLREIVPEAQIAIGHGQMPESELEKVMLRFVEGQFDLLLATTIVESGLDIPNANTIFIDDADRYGLADLHQLRGRVGRYKHRAYCYLLVDPRKHLSSEAARRLRAIEELSDMGAGFAIAMRDLEIRGAGSILGTQQSGHISAVGYELYCTLLEQAVRRLKRLSPADAIDVSIDLPGAAYLPVNYVPDQRSKIDLYRRLARIKDLAELEELVSELADRFGQPPVEVGRLLARAEVRIRAHGWKIVSLHREDGFVVFGYADRRRIEGLNRHLEGRLRLADERSAYLPLDGDMSDPDRLFEHLKTVLRPD